MNKKRMTIQVDTREHDGKNNHVLAYFLSKGAHIIDLKLDVGDYMNYDYPYVSVDRKQNIYELIGNITHDHERFKRELERAQVQGVKLIVLVEEYFSSIYSLKYWKSRTFNGKPLTKMKGETVMKILLTMQKKYGVEFRFCHKEDSGRIIYEILEKAREEQCQKSWTIDF